MTSQTNLLPEEILREEINQLMLKKDEIDKAISSKFTELRNSCTHSQTETKKEFFEGSYLNKSYWETYDICKICGYRKLLRTEFGGYG